LAGELNGIFHMATSQTIHTYDAVQSNFSECHPWYAVHVQARYEQSVASSLRSRGYRDFLPVYSCMRRWSDRVKKVELPLFPGYLFCRFDVNHRLPILTTPGVINIVGVGKLPHPVEEDEISALQIVAGSGLLLEPWPFLKTGERVRIEDGPLRNVEGMLSEIGDSGQLVVSISLLQRSVAVTIDRSWVRPVSA
jgi:transcription antitermination factor NusG